MWNADESLAKMKGGGGKMKVFFLCWKFTENEKHFVFRF